MKTAFLQLLRGLFGHKTNSIKHKRRRLLEVETLERREVPASIATSGTTVFIEGTAGNDLVNVSINTQGDNDIYNDVVNCSVTHNGITDTKSFFLNKWSANGPIQLIQSVQINGLGGSDTINDTTNLNLYVWQDKINGGDQAFMGYTRSDGEFFMKGTNANDTASFSYTWSDVKGTLAHNGQVLTVNKLSWDNSTQIVKKLGFEGWNGNDNFENNTFLPVHAFGGQGKDTLIGGYSDDLLVGDGEGEGGTYDNPLGGDDFIDGRVGNDTIHGGMGNDLLYGGLGNDAIYAWAGNDLVDGGDGDDYLQADAGDDLVWGGAGNDAIWGNAGNDLIWGGAGNDDIQGDGYIGEVGNDKIYGGLGDDSLYDDQGHNQIYGNEGNDVIFVSHVSNYNKNTDTNYVEGGLGNDYILSYGGVNHLHGNEGNDTLTAAGGGIAPGHDFLYGDAGDDQLFGGKWDAYLEGGLGTDALFGGAGNDTLLGCEGNDLLIGGLGTDFLDGGLGNDMLIGGLCDSGKDGVQDTLVGGPGNDLFFREDNHKGGNIDWATDFAPGDQLLDCVNWFKYLQANNFQK